MADPKYANLPGIAYDQPDCYETCDLPEADQSIVDVQEESDSIERLHLNANDAYRKFKGKDLDASKTDFSDRISRQLRTGYDVHGEYEMVGDGSKEPETPQQKYQRLQHEIRELMEDVGNIKAEAGDKKESPDVVGLTKQAEGLNKQLQNIKLEQVLGSEIIDALCNPQGNLQKKLISDLDSFKQGQSSTGSSKTKTKDKAASKQMPDSSQLLYELHYRPEVAKFTQNAKIADMEQRLQQLESVIGKETDKLVLLSSDTNRRSVLGNISILNSKLNLLDPAHIDQVDAHLAALSLRLAQLADKRATVEDAEKLNKVSELYDLLKKTESLTTELPQIVERMVALKGLHEQALQFSNALSQLDATQQQISVSLNSDQDKLAFVQKEFANNMDLIKTNMANLDARISAIKK